MKHEMAVTGDIPAALVRQPDEMAAHCQYQQAESPRRKNTSSSEKGLFSGGQLKRLIVLITHASAETR